MNKFISIDEITGVKEKKTESNFVKDKNCDRGPNKFISLSQVTSISGRSYKITKPPKDQSKEIDLYFGNSRYDSRIELTNKGPIRKLTGKRHPIQKAFENCQGQVNRVMASDKPKSVKLSESSKLIFEFKTWLRTKNIRFRNAYRSVVIKD
jgi:hypothetical protein